MKRAAKKCTRTHRRERSEPRITKHKAHEERERHNARPPAPPRTHTHTRENANNKKWKHKAQKITQERHTSHSTHVHTRTQWERRGGQATDKEREEKEVVVVVVGKTEKGREGDGHRNRLCRHIYYTLTRVKDAWRWWREENERKKKKRERINMHAHTHTYRVRGGRKRWRRAKGDRTQTWEKRFEKATNAFIVTPSEVNR